MIIGIDGSRAFLKQRTGIEEYSYQVIKHLRERLKTVQVILYLRKNQKVDFVLPKNWKIKILKWPRFWTQVGLSLEMLFYPVDVLFIPAHVAPLIHPARNASLFSLALFIQKLLKKLGVKTDYNTHSDAGEPKKTFVVIHGLEFEIMREAYSFLGRLYMRWSIKRSCKWAKKIIAVSKNTKKDLMELYKVPEKKIEVIYEGVSENFKTQISKLKTITQNSKFNTKYLPTGQAGQISDTKYLLFIGRLEKRKNIEGIISAFEILKEKYNIPHSLVLAGSPGYGYESSKLKVQNSKFKNDIIEMGYVSEEEKFSLIENADVFLFPTFYEGFGLPILEAQAQGVPVVTSNVSSMPEVGGDSVAYSTPSEPISIADSIYKIISDENFRNDLIKKGNENVKKFSWEKCAEEISQLLIE
jgi:glycosyltransferase involved in cell wall biosynthesis